jgi:hypothetical protein
VHNLVHTQWNFSGCSAFQRLPLDFGANVTVALGHPNCGARRPAQNLRNYRKCSAVFQKFRGQGVSQIVKPKSVQCILHDARR